jgi:hypothetical protein
VLSYNQIGDEGARALAEALRQPGACPALQSLTLDGNSIGDEGLRALAEASRQPDACPALLELDVLSDFDEMGPPGAPPGGSVTARRLLPSTPDNSPPSRPHKA